MNLLEIRKHFRALSGRYDLIDDDPSNTVNLIINHGSRWLDRQTEHQKSFGSHFGLLTTGLFNFSIPLCRAIKEVWVYNTTSRWQLEKKNLQDICAGYLSSTPTNSTTQYYSPVITRKIPEDADLSSFATYLTYLDTITNVGNEYNGIVIVPPSDVDLAVEVRGYYYSAELVNPDDQNFWTVSHPMTLLKSAMRELEVFNGNASKIELWEKALLTEVTEINKDLVTELISEVNVMESKIEDEIN